MTEKRSTTSRSSDERSTIWFCVSGHTINNLADETEEVTLDQGALVRLCRHHGAPIGCIIEAETSQT
jgi:mannose-6-phosphate isomerase-like protein (cupin superfamily)